MLQSTYICFQSRNTWEGNVEYEHKSSSVCPSGVSSTPARLELKGQGKSGSFLTNLKKTQVPIICYSYNMIQLW
jgi:hypothetical protein